MSQNQPFTLTLRGAADPLRVYSLRGREALSEPYRFELDVVVPRTVDPDAWLGADASLLMVTRAHERGVAGIIERVRRGDALADGDAATVRLRLVPRLRRLALRRHSRVFQDKSTGAIVALVTGEHGVKVRPDLLEKLPSREICIQHEETDLAFITRLLAEEGIAYRFEQPADPAKLDAETVVLFDAAARYLDLPEGRELAYRLEAEEGAALHREEHHVPRFVREQRRKPASVMLRAFDFKRPELFPEGIAPDKDALTLERVLEHHGPYGEMQVEPQKAAVVREQVRRRALVATGTSNCGRLSPGFGVTLVDHPDGALNADYAVVRVVHRGQELSDKAQYENEFQVVSRAELHRPARPERRVRQSLETATVSGPKGEDIHTDKHGRIKIQFHWDVEGKSDGLTSCWIRVAQSWSGSNWGAQFIPRVGMEVLVAFLGGDPDRPVVVGCLPNGTHAPPFPLPGDKSRSGWRTRSTPFDDRGGHNEISMDDDAGQEQVRVIAQRDLDIEVKHAMRTRVSGEQLLEVAANRMVSIGGRHELRVEGAASQEFRGGGRIAVRGRLDEDIEGARAVKVGESLDETIEGSVTRTVAADEEHTVRGPWTCNAESLHTLVVGTRDSVGHAEVQVRGTSVHATDGAALFQSAESLTLVCGESRLEILPDRIRLTSPMLELLGKEVIAKGDGPSLRLTDKAELMADSLKLYGKESSLELEKDALLKGQKIYLNCGPPPPPPEDEKGEPATKPFSVRLQDEHFEPYADKNYELRSEGFKLEGKTSGDGLIEQDIPKSAKVAHVDLWTAAFPTGPRKAFAFNVEEIPAISTLPGLRIRLRNLGYFKGRTDGDELDAATQGALRDFQHDHELESTGQPDAPTLAAITQRFEG